MINLKRLTIYVTGMIMASSVIAASVSAADVPESLQNVDVKLQTQLDTERYFCIDNPGYNNAFNGEFHSGVTSNSTWRLIPVENEADTYYIYNVDKKHYLRANANPTASAWLDDTNADDTLPTGDDLKYYKWRITANSTEYGSGGYNLYTAVHNQYLCEKPSPRQENIQWTTPDSAGYAWNILPQTDKVYTFDTTITA